MPSKLQNVLVTGSFDLLHSGHIFFLECASEFGRLYVGIGSDKSIEQLKDRPTVNKEDERLYMVMSIKGVEDAWVNGGMGLFDFFDDNLSFIDILIVNKDQDFKEKRKWCRDRKIEYIVLDRKAKKGLPEHSSTEQRKYLNL